MKAAYVTADRPKEEAVAEKVHIDDSMIPAISEKSLKEGEILVNVKAFSMNFDDINIVRGTFLGGMPGMQLTSDSNPVVIGSDFAGVITAVGSKVATQGKFKIGQRVCGINKVSSAFKQAGTWAEYTTSLPENLAIVPDDVSYEDAAALVMPVLVIHGMLDIQRPTTGNENILVIGASGGIGSMLVQILRKSNPSSGGKKVHITGVCSGRNAEFVKALGADQIIDYTKDATKELSSLTGTGRPGAGEYDIVYDLVGGKASYETGKLALRTSKGHIISSTGPVEWLGDEMLSSCGKVGLISKMLWQTSIRNRLPGKHPYYHLAIHLDVSKGESTFSLACDNGVRPHIGKLIDMDNRNDFVEAIDLVKSHRAKGKIVVKVA